MSIIEVKNLSKNFKKVVKTGNILKDLIKPKFVEVSAVQSVSFSIEKGESVAFLGPNGAGKTTTIKMLTGLVFPTSGSVKVINYKPFDRNHDFLKRIGLVMGNKSGLNWDLTPKQSFELIKAIYEIPDDKFIKRLEELTKLLDTDQYLDTQVRRLSLGERMKMELIGAILHKPEVLFLDEPTIGLDVTSKKKIREFLRKIQQEDEITMLLTSHDMDDIEKVCDRVIVINKGTKVFDDNIENLTKRYDSEQFIKFYFDETPKKELLKRFNIVEINNDFVVIKSDSKKLPETISIITTEFLVKDIDIISTPLEDIIEDIYTSN